jgi:hypothetical protein
MANDLQITITHEEFEKIPDSANQSAIDKKLNIIFKVVSPLQEDIAFLKENAKDRVNICDLTVRRLEKTIEESVNPKFNKTKIAGVGVSGTALGALIAKGPEWLNAIMEWFHK